MSESVGFSSGGEQTSFDGDKFMRACLREMIVEAPWGRTTETFLLSIDSRLGTALEQLVPNMTGAEENPDEIKKDA
jgi:predicted P-loop ATPase/GTPase